MELARGDLRPGKVLQVVDNIGTIKVSAPGMFTDQDDVDLLPPVFPLFTIGSNTFSSPNVGDSIWLLSFRGNAQELFYFRMVDHKDYMKNIGNINNNSDIECVVRKQTDNGWGELYLDTGEGWIIANGDCKAVIDNSGNVNLIGNSVRLGSSSASNPVCKYEETEALLKMITNVLGTLAAGVAETAPSQASGATTMINMIKAQIPKIKSSKIYVDR